MISTNSNQNPVHDAVIDVDTNLIRLMKTLEHCRRAGTTCFNFVSSWFVYGPASGQRSENDLCDPRGFYSITKHTAERLLQTYCESWHMAWRTMRLANVIGPGDRGMGPHKNVLTWMIHELAQGRDVVVDSDQWYRDFIHVEDACRAMDLVQKQGDVDRIYNIGNGVPCWVPGLLAQARDMIPGSGQILYRSPSRPVGSCWLDTQRLRDLGYRAEWSMSDAVAQLVEQARG